MNLFAKVFLFGFFLFSALGCGSVDADVKNQIQLRVINVFSLATHQKTGSCTELPIRHRYISFQVFNHPREGDDVFIGFLEVALDEDSKTYTALYRELPGIGNVNQTEYSAPLSGTYAVSESDDKDYLTLKDLGVVTATIDGQKVKFEIKLDAPIHRQLLNDRALGYVLNGATQIFDDSCPP